nr:MAG TPA: hypothetical protein [Caudoviricetes sp.]
MLPSFFMYYFLPARPPYPVLLPASRRKAGSAAVFPCRIVRRCARPLL